MSFAHLHLVLLHFPLVGFPLATLFAGWALLPGSIDAKQQRAKAASVLFLGFALLGIATFFTGEPAESLATRAGVDRTLIHAHEEAGEFAVWLMAASGLAAAVALAFARHPAIRFAVPTLLGLGLAASVSLGWTAYEGGRMRHPEAFYQVPQVSPVPAAPGIDSVPRGTASEVDGDGHDFK